MKLIFLFLIFISFSTLSQQVEKITCYSTVYAPYSFLKDDQPTGIDVDLVTYIADKINISVSFEVLPWSRLTQSMMAGNIDCAMAFLENSKYAINMVYMNSPITTGEHTIFIDEKNKETIQDFNDLYGLTIGVNRGFITPTTFQQAVSTGKIKQYEVGNEEQSLQMLLTSRIDGVLTDKNVGLYNLQQMEISNISLLPKGLIATPVFLVFSPKWQEKGIVEKFNDELKKMKQDGTYQRIFNNYITDK